VIPFTKNDYNENKMGKHPIDNILFYTNYGKATFYRFSVICSLSIPVAFALSRFVSRKMQKYFLAFFAFAFMIYELIYIRRLQKVNVEKNDEYLSLKMVMNRPSCSHESFLSHCVLIGYNIMPIFMNKFFITGKTKECNEIKECAITVFTLFSDSIYVYVPQDFTIPPYCIIITNHTAYMPPENKYPWNNSRDSLGLFHYLREDQQLYIVAHGNGMSLELLYNSYNVSKFDKEKRRRQYNKLCGLTRENRENEQPFSVVIYAMDHRPQILSVYHHTKIFDGAIALALYSGAFVIPVFNAFFIDKNEKEHFRQIAGKPFLPLKRHYTFPLEKDFCLDAFRRKYPSYLKAARMEIEKCFSKLTKDLESYHDNTEYETSWVVVQTSS